MALSDVILMRRGGLNPVRLAASAIRVSWEITAFGSLTCNLVTSELIAKGLPLELESWWLRWEHPTAGPWGGVITDSGEMSDGTLKIVAAGYGVLMERRFVGITAGGTAGSLLADALSQAAAYSPTFLDLSQIDRGGPYITPDMGLIQVYEGLLAQLVRMTDWEWQVDADRVVHWQFRIGTVRTLRLAQGLHVVAYQTAGSRPLIENFLYGTGRYAIAYQGQTFDQEVWSWVYDQASIDRHGRIDGQRDYGAIYSPDVVTAALQIELSRSANPPRTATVTLVEVAGEWASFREGDTVRLALGEAAVEYVFRIRARTIDADAGTMELAGEVTRV